MDMTSDKMEAVIAIELLTVPLGFNLNKPVSAFYYPQHLFLHIFTVIYVYCQSKMKFIFTHCPTCADCISDHWLYACLKQNHPSEICHARRRYGCWPYVKTRQSSG